MNKQTNQQTNKQTNKNGTRHFPPVKVTMVTTTYRLRTLDEDLGPPELPLIGLHVDSRHEVLDALGVCAVPTRVGLRCQDGIPGVGRWHTNF